MPYIGKKKWARMEGLLQEIRQLLEQRDGSDMQGDAKVQVHIETLHMHEVKLDDLSFRLDQISIDDLSGSFNLGNNFLHPARKASGRERSDEAGATGGQAKDKARASSGQATQMRIHTSESSGGTGADGLERSATGFRFRFKP